MHEQLPVELAVVDIDRSVYDGLIAQTMERTGVPVVLSGDQERGMQFRGVAVMPDMQGNGLPVICGQFVTRSLIMCRDIGVFEMTSTAATLIPFRPRGLAVAVRRLRHASELRARIMGYPASNVA